MEFDLTKEERNAITMLKRLAKRWPDTLWLWAGNGLLSVMRKGPDGKHAKTGSDCVDPDYEVDAIDIENDGGGW